MTANKFVEKELLSDIEIEGDILDLRKGGDIEGVYIGSRTFDAKKAGEVTTIHYFKRPDNKIIACWGQKNLNDKLVGEEGKTVKASFLKKKPLADGRTKNMYSVQVAQ